MLLIHSKDIRCELCADPTHDDELLLCKGCNTGYHISCLDPPLDRVPEINWYCSLCDSNNNNQLKTGDDNDEDEDWERDKSSANDDEEDDDDDDDEVSDSKGE